MTDTPAMLSETRCRVLLVNPNTSAFMTRRMVEVARSVAVPTTRIVGVEAATGLPYIASRAEAALAGAWTLELLAEHHANYDVAVIAAFGDPGLFAARELLPIPVLGLAEAAMLTACMLGRRFSIVSFSPALAAWYRECVAMHGLQDRLASLRLVEEPFADIETVSRDKRERVIALARHAVDRDGADVVITAGAPLSGLAAEIQGAVSVPVVDPIVAAIKQAEAIAGMGLASPPARPKPASPKPSIGLAPKLAALLADARLSR